MIMCGKFCWMAYVSAENELRAPTIQIMNGIT